MLEATHFEEVTQIRMSRELEGKAVYWVAAHLVDGLLVDTGCSHTAGELVDFLGEEDLRLVVNTHPHEDHTGADQEIMARFGVDIYAHPRSIPLIADRLELHPYRGD
jgi:glyoxylase-like metal-dependent hydrolase (beta-lactamase superfamily II)